MKRYFFGYVFVRFAKIIAVLVFLGGLGGAAVRYIQGSLEAASVRYEPGRLLGTKLFTLSQEWDRTRKLVEDFGRGTAPPPETQPFQISKAPGTVAEFTALDRQFSAVQGQREALKTALVQQFESAVSDIEAKLRAHAASLKGEPPPKPPKPAPPAAGKVEVEPPRTKTLFASLGRSELELRRGTFDESRNLLGVLRSSAENPDNEKILGQAMEQLDHLQTLLPASLDTASPTSPPPRVPEPEPDAPAPPPAPKLNAERVADQLQQVRNSIHTALLTEWAVDRAFDDASAEASHEQARCVEAERALKRLWLNVGYTVILLLVGSAFTAFLILVLADLTQSLLDTATHSGFIAAAYRNAAAGEEEPSSAP